MISTPTKVAIYRAFIRFLYFYCIFSSVEDNLYYKIINFGA